VGVDALKPAAFLDRDGVLNRAIIRGGTPYPPASPDALEILPGVGEALARLKTAGYALIVVTNQPDIARGVISRAAVDDIHARMRQLLPLDEIRVCPHDDADGCSCRKPKAGLLLREPVYDLGTSVMVGDRWRDIEAGRAAGCKATILVDYGYGEAIPHEPDARVRSLPEAVDWLLGRRALEQTQRMRLADLRTKIYADGADLDGMLSMYREPHIKGFTTNPTLMRKAGVTDYGAFARQVLRAIPDRPISFEVFSDDFREMEQQAREIATWGEHVYVKIPVTNTRREPAYELVHRLSQSGVKVNVTAVMTLEQVRSVADALSGGAASNVSVFAGRIADAGRDPVPHMRAALEILQATPRTELIWASPRELLNVFQANEIGCHIITVTNDILKKLSLVGKDLDEYSLETVKMFYDDARAAGFRV
jgi:transaldolase